MTGGPALHNADAWLRLALLISVLAAGCAPETEPLGSDLGATIQREICKREAECFGVEGCTWADFLDEDLCRDGCDLNTQQARRCLHQTRSERCPVSVWDLWPECLAAIECEEVAMECIEWQFN